MDQYLIKTFIVESGRTTPTVTFEVVTLDVLWVKLDEAKVDNTKRISVYKLQIIMDWS